MSATVTTPSPAPPRDGRDRPRAALAVLDYAPAPEPLPKAVRRWFREVGPWVIWPSRRSLLCLALLAAAATWLSWLPRNCLIVAEFQALDGPTIIGGTNRVFYRAADHSLWIRDFGSDAGGVAQVQLEPSATHTSPVVSADGTRVLGFAETDLVVWETRTGDMLGRVSLNKLQHAGQMPFAWDGTTITPDGKRLAVRYGKGEIVVWDVSRIAAPRIVATRGPDPMMLYERPSFSGDGRYLLVSRSNSVWVGEADTMKETLKLSFSQRTYVEARWARDGRRLIVLARTTDDDDDRNVGGYDHVEPTRAPVRNEQFYRLQLIDPADPAQPLLRVAYWNEYTQSADLSSDGQKLVVDGEAIYDVRAKARGEWPAERNRLHAVLGDDRPDIVRVAYGWFINVIDGRSGRVTARVPYFYHPPMVLADGQTLLARDPDGLVRARRLDPQRRSEPSAWQSWRLWAMAPLALLLTASLWRDALRRRRQATVSRLDSRAAGTMIALGVAALAAGMASIAVDRNFLVDVWWSGHWAGWCMVPLIACGVGMAAGSRAWTWVTRALLAVFALIATVHAVDYYGNEPPYLLLDVAWSPPFWLLHAACALCAAAAMAGALYLGQRQAVRPA